MKTLLETDPDIKKAHNIYQEFTGNSKFREVYEARLKWQRDYEGRLNYEQKKAREEGLEEGMEKGREEGMEKGRQEEKVKTAIELLKLDMSIDMISKATGLSADIIEGLKKEL